MPEHRLLRQHIALHIGCDPATQFDGPLTYGFTEGLPASGCLSRGRANGESPGVLIWPMCGCTERQTS